MKQSIAAALLVMLFWALLPLLSLPSAGAPTETLPPASAATAPSESPEAPSPAASSAPAPTQAPAEAQGFDESFQLPVLRKGRLVSLDLHSYLTGVLLGEMPMSFETEALKAQAVACRTYALRLYRHRRHGDAAICTNSNCCQAWRDPETADPADRARAEEAVLATDGLAAYYDGALIDATFFSCSGGRTEAAAAVWGSDFPYLQPVDSPGEEEASYYVNRRSLSLSEFKATLQQEDPAVDFSGPRTGWIGVVTHTEGGGVESMVLGGRSFRGTRLRSLFSLRSTDFSLELTDTEAVFTTHGYGHRVGMSQYGANAMAKDGNDFETILKWYYQGIEIRPAG